MIGHDPYAAKRKGGPDVRQYMLDVDANRDGPFLDGSISRRLARATTDNILRVRGTGDLYQLLGVVPEVEDIRCTRIESLN